MIARDTLVVVPTLNEAAHIEGVLQQLFDDAGVARMLIVVADGGSTDGTPEIVARIAAARHNVVLLHNPKRLQSAAVNAAVAARGAGMTWLGRVDAHAAYPPNYVSRLIAVAEETGADSVTTSMVARGETCFQRAAAAAQNSRLGTGGSAHRAGTRSAWVDHGHHALMRMAAFVAAGGYDETFSHNEDAELDHRLGAQGSRIWLTTEVAIDYFPRRTARALFRQYRNYGQGRARTVRLHRTPLKIRQMLPLAVAPAIMLALASPAFWPLALPALVWAGTCLGYGLVLGRDRCSALAGWPAMVMHLGWSLGFLGQWVLGREPVSRA
ncbi:MAG: glycosyltransferase family 2 protein [Phenylobacterium sp.]|uniref:glycosyltransferase family 2 protein n=1 Tax=Phenylobacterium sp. TaxID=1871053 RepID=UPI00391AAE87